MYLYKSLKPLAKRVAVAALSANWFRLVPARIKLALVQRAGVCDWNWYARIVMHDPSKVHEGPAHFLRVGNKQGSSPSPLFDPSWYMQRFSLNASPLDALCQYVIVGDRLGLAPSVWFDPRYCRSGGGGGSLLRPVLGSYLRDFRSTGTPHPLFDQRWYLEQYPDVSGNGVNPLVHFLYDGIAEGRLPNPYFSPKWYAETYPDVGGSQVDPLYHYVRYGAAEGRSPGPDFNSQQYLDTNPDAAGSGMNALAHYLAIGRNDGRPIGKRPLTREEISEPSWEPVSNGATPIGVVDIVLPVYRDLEITRNCIESVLASVNRTPVRLHIYNDCSPEPAVTAYLRKVAASADTRVNLVENVKNLGFVGTVNAGMALAISHPDSLGALLLNSDTIVSGDWVDRLLAHMQDDVASVTALSNNATICSFPKLGPNPLASGLASAEVDQATRAVNAGVAVDIPTGVGFCMLISRAALVRGGLFDIEAFGKGYGEENDFCMRVAKLGFRHRLAMDVFVEHVGEVSFADDSKPGKINAQKIIDERYPDYGQRVARYCSMDPALPARVRLSARVWSTQGRPVTLLLSHAWGGGTERAVQEKAAELGEQGEALIIRPMEEIGEGGIVKVTHLSEFDPFEFSYRYKSPQDLADLFATFGAANMQLHHLVGFGNSVRRALALARIPYTFHVHDNYTICPQITLTDSKGYYCGEPGPAGCDACIAERPSNGASDIRNWRTRHEWAALGAQHVIAPSRDAAARMQRYTGVPVYSHYHEPDLAAAEIAARKGPGAKPYRILLLGVLAPHKGLGSLLDLAAVARSRKLPVQFHLIGYPDTTGSKRIPFTYSGPYEEQDLDAMIAEYSPDAFLFLSQAPETYSYTLSHAISTGLPIAANRLGAFTERLEDYKQALLLPHASTGEETAVLLLDWLESIYAGERA